MSAAEALPEALLPYQQELLAATRAHEVVVVEKSRRIGVTWAIAADAVLSAALERPAGGEDVLYLGYKLDLAREFIDTCAMWASAFALAAGEVQQFLFRDGEDRDIQAYRIKFASGFDVVALSSRPRSLRGRQGYVILDEAAYHDDLQGVLKAALALLIWGGRVLVISTHDGVENPFNELCEEVRAGKRPFCLLRFPFDDAVEQGLYRRVCLARGLEWSEPGERAWVEGIRRFYGADAAEELDCIPRDGGGKYLSRALLEARAVELPILRLTLPSEFVDLPEPARVAEIDDWLREHAEPVLDRLDPSLRSFLGEDFARSGDLTILWPLQIHRTLRRVTPFIFELRNVPFTSQWQVVRWLINRLPRFGGAAFDSGVNGAYLAEVARQQYGPALIAEVQITEHWYREAMPVLKAAIEDDSIDLAKDAEVIDDFRAVELIRGVPRPRHTQGEEGKRHGDSAIACALALHASREMDSGPMRFHAAGGRVSSLAYAYDPDLHRGPSQGTEP